MLLLFIIAEEQRLIFSSCTEIFYNLCLYKFPMPRQACKAKKTKVAELNFLDSTMFLVEFSIWNSCIQC